MKYANIKNYDIADGLGVRVSLFVSGCHFHCKGCFNEIAWSFDYGKEFTDETINYILELMDKDYIDGLTLLGGEPFEKVNQREEIKLLRAVKERFPKKNIWAYSGYLFNDIKDADGEAHCEVSDEFISYIDVLVDGQFKIELKDISLKFRGSSNQRIIDVKKTLASGKVTLISELMD